LPRCEVLAASADFVAAAFSRGDAPPSRLCRLVAPARAPDACEVLRE
jgi:hypothetical protein